MKFICDKFQYKQDYYVYGLTKELDALYIANYFDTHDENVLVLTSTLYEANNFYKSLQAYKDDVLFFPMDDFLASVALAISPDLKIKRLETLEKITKEKKKHLVVTSLMGYLKYLPNKDEQQSLILDPSPSNISREIILEKLEEFGYHRESLVTTTGEYAVRGFIIDIFPVDREKPVRIEFFGDDLENIKEFDENTQLTIGNLESIEIKKFNEEVDSDASSIMDYLGNSTAFLIDEGQIETSYKNLQTEIFEYNLSKELDENTKYMFNYEDIKVGNSYKIETINNVNREDSLIYVSKEMENFGGNFETLKKYCEKETKNKTVVCTYETDKQKKELSELFENALITNTDNIFENKINLVNTKINKGFIFEKYAVISPYDIDKTNRTEIKYKNTIKIGRKVKSYTDLEEGDYIVHEMHGIGIYRGLKTLKNG